MLEGIASPGPPQPGAQGLRPDAVWSGPSVNGAADAWDAPAASARTAPTNRTALLMERPPMLSRASLPRSGRRPFPSIERRPLRADPTPVAGRDASGVSAVDGRHVRIPVARRLAGAVQVAQLLLGQVEVERGDVLLEVARALGPRDRDDVLALRVDPRQRDLGGRRVVCGRDRVDPLDDRDVRLQVLAEHPRLPAAEVVVGEPVERGLGPQRPGEEAAAERAV